MPSRADPPIGVGTMKVATTCGRGASSAAEQGTFNPLVEGSNPSRLATFHAQTSLAEAFAEPPTEMAG